MSYYKTNLKPIEIDQSDNAIKSIYENVQNSMGFIPNLFKNLGNTPELLKAYLLLSELSKDSQMFSGLESEIISLAISKFNNCSYCIASHNFAATKMYGVSEETINNLTNQIPISDSNLQALYNVTSKIMENRGYIETSSVEDFLQAGYTEKHLFYIILVIAMNTISNFSNHLLQTEIDQIFIPTKANS